MGKEIHDAKDSMLVVLLTYMAEWFSDHEQASKDCRSYIETKDLFDKELLDEVFGKDEIVIKKEDLPREVTIAKEDLDVSDWDDEDEVLFRIDMYLEDKYGYAAKDTYDWSILTDREDEIFAIVVNNLEWL